MSTLSRRLHQTSVLFVEEQAPTLTEKEGLTYYLHVAHRNGHSVVDKVTDST